MGKIWTYENGDLSNLVGSFYTSAGSFNGFKHTPAKSFIDRLFGPDAWYKAEFKKNGIESKICEWRNILAFDDFLDSIEIKYNSQRVYLANVHRNNPSVHTNQKVCAESEWVREIIELTKKYSS